MERMTEKGIEEVFYRVKTGGHAVYFNPQEILHSSEIEKVLRRLAAYEDTGLTPEEITDLLGRLETAPKKGFDVIDTKTGTYPDCEKIALTEEWAKHLIYCDIDCFAINEDGNLLLIDDCNNIAYAPADRFKVVFNHGGEGNDA